MSRIDLPPVWTLFGIGSVWALSRLEPGGWSFGAYHVGLGVLVLALGLGLMFWAAMRMLRQRTTVMPRREAEALVTDGPFRLSRNPIYLGDLLLLAAAALLLDAPTGLLLVPVLAQVLTRRFIRSEEAMLRARFGAAFEAWSARTRRWL